MTRETPDQTALAARPDPGSELVALFDALPAHVALLDDHGIILGVNEAWRRFANANLLANEAFCVGGNYIEICESAHGDCADEARRAAAGIRSVLRREVDLFTLDYPCHSPSERRWFQLNVTRAEGATGVRAVVTHFNVTDRKLAEEDQRQRANTLQAELLHVARLSDMGLLASELAHEINQPLSAIMNYLELTRFGLRDCPSLEASPTLGLIDKIEGQVARASGHLSNDESRNAER